MQQRRGGSLEEEADCLAENTGASQPPVLGKGENIWKFQVISNPEADMSQ